MSKLLIIDDEKTICTSLMFALEDEYEITTASNIYEVESALNAVYFDVVLLDLKFGDISGLDLLPVIKQKNKTTPVIMMTAYASVKSSIDAMKMGVYDYIMKPIDIDKLRFFILKAVEYKNLNEKISRLESEMKHKNRIHKIIGTSKKLQDVFHIIDKVKSINMSVLIEGQSGTGKELVAHEIHNQGNRKNHPFEVVNCGAIPSTLIESELFGYEKGAFTGADTRKKGLFELADKGTLFLDEIGEMDLHAQVKLLRVLQSKEIFPLGSESSKKVDVRIIAATNKDLKEEVAKGQFREDLYFRLNVVRIKMPPLKNRLEDIPMLIEHFIKQTAETYSMPTKRISRDALTALETYGFPGNVRELQNIIERALVFASGDTIHVQDLPESVSGHSVCTLGKQSGIIPVPIGTTLKEAERLLVEHTLEYHQGNRRKTAETLGMSERNLRYKIKEYQEGAPDTV
jgi:two-component system response regulator AtoC